jgi:O-antigen ligase
LLQLNETRKKVGPLGALGFVIAVIVTFVLMGGIDLDNARQIFDESLATTVETFEGGSLLRPVVMFAFAGYAAAILATMSRIVTRPAPLVLIPLVGFLLVVVASGFWAIDPSFSFRRIGLFILLLVGAVAGAALLSMRSIISLTVLFAGVTVLAAIIAHGSVGTFALLDGGWRLGGVLHPIALSWYAGLGALGSLAIARLNPFVRIPANVALVGFSVALIATKSRTAILATLLGAAALILLSSDRRLQPPLLVAATWLALGVFLVALSTPGEQFTWTSVYGEVTEATSFGREDAVEQIDTFTGRLPAWEATLRLAADRPLLGYGYNSFASPEMIPIFSSEAGWVLTSPHSGYIDAVFSVGAIGSALLLLLLVGAFARSLQMARHLPAYGFTVAVLVWLVINMAFEAPVFYDTMFITFLIFTLILKVGLFPDPPSEQR